MSGLTGGVERHCATHSAKLIQLRILSDPLGVHRSKPTRSAKNPAMPSAFNPQETTSRTVKCIRAKPSPGCGGVQYQCRTSSDPDASQQMGRHKFRWGILAHPSPSSLVTQNVKLGGSCTLKPVPEREIVSSTRGERFFGYVCGRLSSFGPTTTPAHRCPIVFILISSQIISFPCISFSFVFILVCLTLHRYLMGFHRVFPTFNHRTWGQGAEGNERGVGNNPPSRRSRRAIWNEVSRRIGYLGKHAASRRKRIKKPVVC